MRSEDVTTTGIVGPDHLFPATEGLARPPPVPSLPEVYAWYFDEVLPGVPTDGCQTVGAFTLLYVSNSPKAPPKNGRSASKTNLRHRVTYHFKGNAERSTLRLTLDCLLADRIVVRLQRVGSGGTKTFTNQGEQRLDAWVADHAARSVAAPEQWILEGKMIVDISLPLNLAGNDRYSFSKTRSGIRAEAVAQARMMEAADRGGPRRLSLAKISPAQ